MSEYTILDTDGYKFSMAEAGAALRQETFYYSHRRGGANGWHYMPIDIKSFIKSILPPHDEFSYKYLRDHSYEVGAGYRKAMTLQDQLKINSVPKGSWFYNREPAFSVTGSSALDSWLEPLALQLQFRIQIATSYISNAKDWENKILYATCEREKEIILETLDSLMIMNTFRTAGNRFKIEVRSEQYYDDVFNRAKGLVDLVGNPDRIFEVGMRGVSCIEQHEIALNAIKNAGIIRTSNVGLAEKLGMIPVGTMGHEHIQRSGSDYAAFTSMRDRFPGFLFYLPDTFDTVRSGVPSALKVIAETPERDAGIRFDSENGIRGHYIYTVVRSREMGLEPILALESGWNFKLTEEFEELRKQIGWKADRQAYGYGGYLVKPSWETFCRDDVSAVWKISQTGSRATMKFGDEPNSGKQSIPGRSVIWRTKPAVSSEIIGYVYQEGEIPDVPDIYLLTGKGDSSALYPGHVGRVVMSPETQKLINQCTAERAKILQEF